MSGSSDSLGFDFESWQKRLFEYKVTGKNRPPHPTIDMMWRSFEKSLGDLPAPIVGLVKQGFYGGGLGLMFVIAKLGEAWNEDEGAFIVNKLEAELGAFMTQQAQAQGVTIPGTSSIIQ